MRRLLPAAALVLAGCATTPKVEPVRTWFGGIPAEEGFQLFAVPAKHPSRPNLSELPVVIDRADGDAVYFLDGRVWETHLDFIHANLLSRESGRTFTENQLQSGQARFLLGWLVRDADGRFLLDFWSDLPSDAETLRAAREAVAKNFYTAFAVRAGPRREGWIDDYQLLNPGVAYGVLRLADDDASVEASGPDDVLVAPRIPSLLPNAAGMLAAAPTGAMAHAVLLARSLEMPLAAAFDARKKAAALAGKLVRFEARRVDYELRAAEPAEAEAWRKERDARRKRWAPPADLEWNELTPLREQRGSDAVRFGAKSANLGEIAAAAIPGVRVPDGFTVPFHYYGRFVRESGLAPAIRAMLDEPRLREDRAYRAKRLAGLRRAFEEADLDAELRREIETRLRRGFAGKGMFVRSSTNAEDLPGFNGAGLYLTVPNAIGAEAVGNAVKRVWASVWNERAWEARERFGIDHAAVVPAVLIQEGVDADNAGVLFTGKRVEISAKQGLGIRVVEGGPSAERLVLERGTLKIKLAATSQDETGLRFDPDGGVRKFKVKRGSRVLEDGVAKRLAEAALTIEALFGGEAQDIEWLTKDGEVVIVQSRPLPEAR